jgi:hypothetical protein
VKRVILALVFFALVGAALAAQTDAAASGTAAGAAPAEAAGESRVFALNLSGDTVDLRLGKDELFKTDGLAHNMPSQLVTFKNFTARSILYKAATSKLWQETKQADGKTLAYNIQAGKTYLILVQSTGEPGLYELSANTDSAKPKIAVANATDQVLPVIQIGTGYGLGTVANALSFGSGWTNFGEVAAGNYGAFWSYATMPAGVAYFYTSGNDGKSLGVTPFVEGGWYFVVIWHDTATNQSGGKLWDITPAKK